MINKLNKFYIKVLLVFVVEAVVALCTHMFIKSVLNLDPPLLVYIIEGSVLPSLLWSYMTNYCKRRKRGSRKSLKN